MSEAPNPKLIALVVAASFFMETLDQTVIIPALPAIAAAFGTTVTAASISITSYVVAVAVFLPLSGWLADRFGPRRVFALAIVAFVATSVLCGLASSLPAFVGARILQGIAGALMSPVGRIVVLRSTAKKDIISAIALITWPGLIAPVLGPPLGGFLTDYASWRWIFFLNVPIGVVGVLMVLRFIPDQRGEEQQGFDIIGFVLNLLALGMLIYGLDRATHVGVSALSLGLVGGGLVAGTVAVLHARRSPKPLVSLDSLSIRSFTVSVLAQGGILRLAIAAGPFLLPLMFQLAFGMDAFAAGSLTLIYFLGNLSMKTVTTPILNRLGFRPVLVGAGLVIALSLAACAALSPTTPLPAIAVVLFVAGASRSMAFTALNTLSVADIPQPMLSGATVLSAIAFQVFSGLGVAVGAALLALSAMLRGTEGAATPADFSFAFACTALLAFLPAILMLRLPADAGASVRQRAGD